MECFQWLLDRRKDMERTTTYVGWLWLVTTDSLLHNNSWNIMICHDNNINIIVVTCCYMLLLLIVDFPGGYTIPIMPLQAPPMISIISKTSRVLATRTRSPGKDSWKFPQKTHAGTASTPRHDTNDLSSPRFLLNVHLYKLVSTVSHVQLAF